MSDLREILREAMREKGHISFARFMELALYCPKSGYYEQKDVSPGQKGDFFTSVSVGSFFGELLAAQFAEWQGKSGDEAGQNNPWQILEAGAHDGRLAGDILRWLKTERPRIFAAVEYWILEPSETRQAVQKKTFAEFAGRVRWFKSWADLPPTGVNGVILSNELLDAMPVHRLGWDAINQHWFEWGVAPDGEHFTWTKMLVTEGIPLPHAALRIPDSALPEFLAVLPDNFTTEVCPTAVEWWREAARVLKAGRLITFDYGLLAEQFFTPERSDGTLRAYCQHQQNNDLLARPGEQDLTAQVNFTTIREAGEAEGLTTENWSSQGQFLVGVMQHSAATLNLTPTRVRQFQTLTHPEHLGRLFRVLVQGRKIE